MRLILLACTALSVFAASGQPQTGTLLWSFTAASQVTSSPALALDGTIYLGTQGALYAITNAGSNKWTFAAGLQGSPAIGTDGTVFFGGPGGTFYALDPNGSVKWTFSAQATIGSSPAIGFDGAIYFLAGGQLFALTSTGAKRWHYPVDDPSAPGISSPVIGSDGTIYVGSYFANTIYALNSDSTLKWQVPLGNLCGDSPAIGANGTVYVTSGQLYALTPSGTNLWSTTEDSFIGTSPAIGPDGTIYLGNRPVQSLWSITPDGQTNWNAVPGWTPKAPPPPTPAIDAGGFIYFCTSNAIFALAPNGSVQWSFTVPFGTPVPPTISSPAIGPDGTIYAAFQNTLYALAGTNPLGNAPWPMYRQNLRHTGKVEKPALAQPKKRADAGFQFQIYDAIGNTDTIQTSPDLAVWSTFTNIVITNVPMDFVDWTASNYNSRFYRTVQP